MAASTLRSKECAMDSKKVSISVGKLKKWFPDRGFGFIEAVTEQGIRRDLFVHATVIRNDSAAPIIGAGATYKVGISRKGLAAYDVSFLPIVAATAVKS